jgi:hypothetical protein
MLRLFNDAVSNADVIQRRITWEVYREWYVYKNLEVVVAYPDIMQDRMKKTRSPAG